MPERMKVVFVKCHLSKASFPTVCFFRLEAVAGEFHGVAPLEYCYTSDRVRIHSELPPGQPIEGWVIGIEWRRGADATVQVELPDGELYDVRDELVQPVEEQARVPVQS